VAARQKELLPVPYFHDVFTLPHELNPLLSYGQRNQRALLGLLFDATAQTLLAFGQSDLGGRVGFTLLLHTWDQRLRAHFHLHCLIACGALSNDGSRWIAGGRQFLFPVHGLSKMFRGKYLDGLAELLGTQPPKADEQPHTVAEWVRILLGIDITRCPCCGDQLQREALPRSPASPAEACLSPSGHLLPPPDAS
jgi:hypothetical protein